MERQDVVQPHRGGGGIADRSASGERRRALPSRLRTGRGQQRRGAGGGGASDFGGVRQVGGDAVEKVLTIEPGEGATLRFKVDYVKGGVGGQAPPGVEGMPVSRLAGALIAGAVCIICSPFSFPRVFSSRHA